MAALDMSTFASSLKQLYTEEKIQNMVYGDNPLWALLPKYDKFLGKNMVIPVIFGNNQGASVDFATAKANKTAGKIKDFTITRSKEYGVASIDNETMEASEGNSNAFLEAVSFQLDGTIQNVGRRLAIAVYGSGTGKIGQIATGGITGSVLTLSQSEDVTNFEVDQKLNFSTANGGGSIRAEKPTVTAVDRNLGKITVSSPTNLAALDFIFADGDYDVKIKGLQAWMPATVSATAFFGMDRSVDASRLGGIQIDGTAKPIEESLIDGASRIAREGGKPTHVFISYQKYADLEKSLGSKVQYVDLKVNAEISFRGVMLNGPRGPMKIIPDQNCPNDKAFMLQLDTWKLYSLGKAPKLLNLDGLKMLREDQADSVELRVGAYVQLACNAPGFNGVIQF